MEKVNYNFGALKKVGTTVVGYVEGWTFQPKSGNLLNVREVTAGGTQKKVATLTINTTLAKSMMKYHLGEEFDKEQHFIEATAWGQTAERLEKFNPSEKMILGVFGELKVQEYDKKDGSGKGKKLVMTIENFKGVTKKKEFTTSHEEDMTPVESTGNMPF